MADPLYFLNPDDKNALQQMLTWFKQRRSNLQSRSPLDLPGRSSDTYIAIPATGTGIPALTRPGTASGTFPEFNTDNPGYAECDIYQIVDLGDGSPTIEPLEFNVIVYNLSESAIDQNWILATRDRFGSWVAVAGGGGTSTVSIKRGKLLTHLSTGNRFLLEQGMITFWEFNGVAWVPTTTTDLVFDDGMLSASAEPLAIGTWIQVVLINGYWFYDGHNCTPETTGTGS